jgi:alkylhydroperoxidase/carboxymuconolactone decarboxylase family protein YurZ
MIAVPDATARPAAGEMSLARPAGVLHDLIAIAGRALRAVPRDPAAVMPRSGLDDRSRALISVAIAATLGTHEPLRGQLRIALNSGVTKEEIVELFIHLEAYAGAARAFDS